MSHRLPALPFLALLLATACGAGDSIDDVNETINCLNACQAWMDCSGDAGFDVDQCQADCEDMAAMSSTFEAQTETCDDCIATQGSCDGGDFPCMEECAGIVP